MQDDRRALGAAGETRAAELLARRGYRIVDRNVRVGGVEVDLMEPIDPDKRPRVHEPPLNHVGLWVDDLQAAVAWLERQGVRFTPGGIRRGAAGHDVCFIHPKGNASAPVGGQGVLIELVQAPPPVVAAWRGAASE